MEDENVQYFIAVAEIQKSNEVLRQQLQFSTKNLDSLTSDISGKSHANLKSYLAQISECIYLCRN